MSTPKGTVSQDDVFTRKTKEAIQEAGQASLERSQEAAVERAVENGTFALRGIKYLLGRGDGWMRWTSDRDGQVVFLKYKFISYKYPNHYVFVSGPIWDTAYLVAVLVRKVEEVDAGTLRPTQDKLFRHEPSPD